MQKVIKKNVIPSYFIRVASYLLAPYLSYFLTLSFDFGVFPDILKIAAELQFIKLTQQR